MEEAWEQSVRRSHAGRPGCLSGNANIIVLLVKVKGRAKEASQHVLYLLPQQERANPHIHLFAQAPAPVATATRTPASLCPTAWPVVLVTPQMTGPHWRRSGLSLYPSVLLFCPFFQTLPTVLPSGVRTSVIPHSRFLFSICRASHFCSPYDHSVSPPPAAYCSVSSETQE